MIAQLSEIYNNFTQFAQAEPFLAACVVAILIVGIGAAAIGLAS